MAPLSDDLHERVQNLVLANPSHQAPLVWLPSNRFDFRRTLTSAAIRPF